MKKIFIVLTFIFISLLTFADNVGIETALKGTEVDLNFNVKLMMGLIKAENNPKYKKLLDYIDENLDKKGEVRYSTKINFKKVSIEYFSKNGELLYEEKLPEKYDDISNRILITANEDNEFRDFVKNSLENPSYIVISKNNGKPKILIENNMKPENHSLKLTVEVILKRELTETEKKEMLSLENTKLLNKYKNYIESDISKSYIDNKLSMVIEKRNLTEFTIMYNENESFKQEIIYTDDTRLSGIIKSYQNKKLLQEVFFENYAVKLQKLYYENGKLETEIPFKNDKVNEEVKIYYENGKIKEITPVKDGKKEGIGREYSETGKIITEILYKDDEEVKKIK